MGKTKLNLKNIIESNDYQAQVDQLSFEASMELLEELVESVERGDLPLDQTVRSYERGTSLIARMKALLEGAEKKLEVLEVGGKKKG